MFSLPRLTVENLNYNYPQSQREIFDGLSFSVESGQGLWLRGKNGAGKTTLLEMLAGFRQPKSGAILYDGRLLERCLVAYLPSIPPLYEELTVLEHISLIKTLWNLRNCKATLYQERVDQSLSSFALPHGAQVGTFSTGMKEKLAFSLITSIESPILLLDEPFTGVDVDSLPEFHEFLRKEASSRIIITTGHSAHIMELLNFNQCEIGTGVLK